MKWFKHYSSARFDKKLTRLKNKYGLRGIGFYWSVLEAIAFQLETNKPLPDLEEDAQDLALFYNEDVSSIEEMAKFCIDEGLLERDPKTGRIMCLKLLMHLDNTMSNNPEIKVILSNFKKLEDNSNSLKQIRLDKTREEKKRKEKDTSAHLAVRAYFETVNANYYHDGKHGQFINRLLNRSHGDIEKIKEVVVRLQGLKKTSDKFWMEQPIDPSTIYSLWNRIIDAKLDKPTEELSIAERRKRAKEMYG